MLLSDLLALLPPGVSLVICRRADKIDASLFEKGNGWAVAGASSCPPDPEGLARGVEQIVRSRFDASYDECEWQARKL